MRKPCHVKGTEISHIELPPLEDVTVEGMHTLLKEQFDALEKESTTPDCSTSLLKIIDEQDSKINNM